MAKLESVVSKAASMIEVFKYGHIPGEAKYPEESLFVTSILFDQLSDLIIF